MANVTIRIDDELKKEAEALFSYLGLSMSSAINVFFRQAIRERAIPFKIKADTGYDEYFNNYNSKRLEESIYQIRKGQTINKTLDELVAFEDE